MPKQPGFNGCFLVLLVVGCILAMFFRHAVGTGREAARRMNCCPKQLTVAFYNYHDTYGTFPPAYTVDAEGRPLHSWRVLLLPFIEQNGLYKKIRLDEPWDSPHNSQFHKPARELRNYYCPSRPEREKRDGLAPYLMVVGPDTPSNGPNCTKLSEITRDKFDVILFVEAAVSIPWMSPQDVPQSALVHGIVSSKSKRGKLIVQAIGSPHGNEAYVAMVDASVPFLTNDKVTPTELLEKSRVRESNENNEHDGDRL